MTITLTNAQRLALIHAVRDGEKGTEVYYTPQQVQDATDGLWYLMHPTRK